MANNENIQEVGVRFTAEGAVEYQRTIKDINADMAQNSAEYQRTTAEIGKNATATEKLTAKARLYEKQIDLQKQKVSALSSELDALTNAEKRDEDAIAKKRKELTHAEATLKKYENTLEDTNEDLEKHAQWSDKASEKVKEFGDKLESAGKKASVVSAGIAAVGVAGIAAFNEVDEGLDIIIKKTGILGGPLLEMLEEDFKAVFSTIPTSAENAGIAVGEVSTRFKLAGTELQKLSGVFIKFAEINNTDLNGSIGKTHKLMEQWELDFTETASVLGLITDKAQGTGISVDALMDSAQKNTSTFKEMGLSFGQSILLLSSFEANGVNAEVALAGLRKSAVAYTKDGLTMEQGINKTIESIKNAKNGTEALAIAQEIFGTKGALEMSNAIREGRISVDDLTVSMQDMGTVVSDTFEATLDAPDQLTVAMNNAKIAGADLGNTIFSMLTPVLVWLTTLMKGLAEWFGGLNDSQKETIVIIGGIVAAIGPLLILFGKMAGAISNIIGLAPTITKGITGINAALSANPIGAVIIAITALVAAFIYLWNTSETFRDIMTRVWNTIKQAFDAWYSGIKTGIQGVVDIFNGLISFVSNVFTGNWKGAWDSVVKIFGGIWAALSGFVKAPINGIISLINGALRGLNKLKIPDWVPGLGGKGINLPMIPMLAAGGDLLSGMAIVAEAGPELIQQQGGKTRVTPLSASSKNSALSGVGLSDETITKLARAIASALRAASDGSGASTASALELVLTGGGRELARVLLPFISQLLAQEQLNLSTARGDL